MSRIKTVSSIAALVILATLASTSIGAETATTEITIGNDTCCFNNPRYTGVCEVTTGPDETCSDVLAYLNNQASVGKTYCGSTKVRGGWAQIECEGAASMCTPPIAATTDADRSE